jgi:glutaredoxin/glutathione-dependent peroxiredoxin
MPSLRLGNIAPDFEAQTTAGPIRFHDWIGDSWVSPSVLRNLLHMLIQLSSQAVLFSHPGDFTPVCTTELGEVARRAEDFKKRGVKVIGISANGLEEHHKWVEDINDYGSKVGPTDVKFPIVRNTSFILFSLLNSVSDRR